VHAYAHAPAPGTPAHAKLVEAAAKRGQEDAVWEALFNINKAVRGRDKPEHVDRAAAGTAVQFERSFLTDGVACSVRISRRKSARLLADRDLVRRVEQARWAYTARKVAWEIWKPGQKYTQPKPLVQGEADLAAAKKRLAFSAFLVDDGPAPKQQERNGELDEVRRRFENGGFDAILGLDPGQKGTTAVVHSLLAEMGLNPVNQRNRGGFKPGECRGAHRHQVR